MINKFEYSDSQKLAILCAQSAQDKLAENTVVLGLEKIEIATSKFMVICDCKSTIQVKSVAENIINNILVIFLDHLLICEAHQKLKGRQL